LELACSFLPGRSGPAAARSFVTGILAAWDYPELVDDAAVIATELATNAVLHAGTEFTVTVSRRPEGTLRVSVRDASLEPPRPRRAPPLAGSGRGLGLVHALAAGWGTDILPDGKVVWAQLV
jgi:anti-sigma regulatory factor (Ser/Thr protein kinase)